MKRGMQTCANVKSLPVARVHWSTVTGSGVCPSLFGQLNCEIGQLNQRPLKRTQTELPDTWRHGDLLVESLHDVTVWE